MWTMDYLSKVFYEPVNVYVDMANNNLHQVDKGGNSFKPSSLTIMKYNEFTEKLKENQFGIVLQESSLQTQKLLEDIHNP